MSQSDTMQILWKRPHHATQNKEWGVPQAGDAAAAARRTQRIKKALKSQCPLWFDMRE